MPLDILDSSENTVKNSHGCFQIQKFNEGAVLLRTRSARTQPTDGAMSVVLLASPFLEQGPQAESCSSALLGGSGQGTVTALSTERLLFTSLPNK